MTAARPNSAGQKRVETYEETQARIDRIGTYLATKDSTTLFCARNLGFPDYTDIHDAARKIIGRACAQVIVTYGFDIPPEDL